VLVADAGTALSLTLVDGDGRFCGGRLAAGVALQLRALAGGTALLPTLDQPWWQEPAPGPWPLETRAAMVRGCLEAVAAAIAQAWLEARGSGGPGGACQLWLTGGDGDQLAPLLAAQGVPFTLASNLALESLAALAWGGLKPASGP
jgi:type III pantothenate kinase